MFTEEELMIIGHSAEDPHKYMGAVTPPVFMNSLHVFDTVKDYYDVDIFKDDFYYGRASNVTVSILEKKLALLENGKRGVVFSAGMAACSAAILSICKAGSHIICMNTCYGPVQNILNNFLTSKFNMTVTYVQGKTPEEFERAITDKTDLIILESPSSLVYSIVDLEKVAQIAKKNNIKTYIDNTYSTPLFQKPLNFGIDIVMHTLTKYIGGHSDLIGGVLISNDDEFMKNIMVQRDWFGSVLGAMEAWLAIRGLRTLPVRIEQHYKTATKVAEFLEKHEKIEKVYYPGLKSHSQVDLVEKQQKGSSGLLTFELKGNRDDVEKFVNKLKVFQIGCSWGGYESLVLPLTLKWSDEQLKFQNVNRNMVRIHCGLEGADNLIDDIEQALR